MEKRCSLCYQFILGIHHLCDPSCCFRCQNSEHCSKCKKIHWQKHFEKLNRGLFLTCATCWQSVTTRTMQKRLAAEAQGILFLFFYLMSSTTDCPCRPPLLCDGGPHSPIWCLLWTWKALGKLHRLPRLYTIALHKCAKSRTWRRYRWRRN